METPSISPSPFPPLDLNLAAMIHAEFSDFNIGPAGGQGQGQGHIFQSSRWLAEASQVTMSCMFLIVAYIRNEAISIRIRAGKRERKQKVNDNW